MFKFYFYSTSIHFQGKLGKNKLTWNRLITNLEFPPSPREKSNCSMFETADLNVIAFDKYISKSFLKKSCYIVSSNQQN